MSRPIIGFAHRGARAHAPENTLEAFRLAIEMGATGLESDVWLSADGVPVLDHDGVVETPWGEVPIGRVSRQHLPPWIPSLRELYEACGIERPLSLDVKDDAAAEPTLAVAREMGAESELWLCHWNWRVLAPWRGLSPSVHLVDSTAVRHMRTPHPERARRMVALGIDALNLHHESLTPELVAPFHDADRAVLGWDAQDEPALERLVALGIDGVFSDHVDRMVKVLGRAR